MRINHKDIEIPIDGTDAFLNCKLVRKPFADILTTILCTYSNGFVLAINNEWGAGKTTFIKMWKQDLKNKGFKTLYYNAWENDFENNVIVALISELQELNDTKTRKAYKAILQKGALLSKKIGPEIIKGILKKTTGINSEEILKIIEGAAEMGFETLEAEIKIYTQRKETLKEFRECLKTFVEKADPEKPVIFFVDELDRCRPNYAVEVLEEIKHLFSVPGIIFVLSIDKEQLGHAVRGVYGSDKINAQEYLRRFIDLEYSLPDPDPKLMCEYLYDYYNFDEFINQDERNAYYRFRDDKDYLILFSSLLFNNGNINLRQAEKIFSLARIGLKSFSRNEDIFTSVYILLVYVKYHHPRIYKKIKQKKFQVQELVDEVENLLPIIIKNKHEEFNILSTIFILASLYNNYFYTGAILKGGITLTHSDSVDVRILLKSKYDPSPDKEKLKEIDKELGYRMDLSRVSLHNLLTKIDLLEPFTT